MGFGSPRLGLLMFAALAPLVVGATPLVVRAEIRELNSMQDAAALVDRETVAIFDIDNTLIRPVQALGSHQWFRYLVSRAGRQGADPRRATEIALDPWMRVQRATRVQSVEASTPAWVAGLQARGIRVMGLTARTDSSATTTDRQLASVGIRLARTAYPRNLRSPGNWMYRRGVLYVGPEGDKGELLLQFLRQIGWTPRRLLFVDDGLANVQSVDRALSRTRIQHIEVRYGAADAWVRQFDPALAERQWEVFSRTGELRPDPQPGPPPSLPAPLAPAATATAVPAPNGRERAPE